MAAVRRHAVDRDAGAAELGPADAAMPADAAARIVVVHDALSDRRLALGDARAARGDDAARLVPGDEGLGLGTEAARRLRRAGRRAIELEIRAAHARGLHFDHDLARPGGGIGKLAHLDLAIAEKHRAAHVR